jgi:hypothetical protein
VVRKITGDNDEGKAQLDNFIDPESTYPVIAVTSRLMSTGVDAQTCKLIVLDRRIASMTEFKQIIGRGTRINEDYGKLFFTIMDFRQATALFADPDFDGDSVQIYEPEAGETVVPPEDEDTPRLTVFPRTRTRPLVKKTSSRIWVITSHFIPSGPVMAGVMNLVRMSVSVRDFLSMSRGDRGPTFSTRCGTIVGAWSKIFGKFKISLRAANQIGTDLLKVNVLIR